MDAVTEGLGRRAVACPRWKWLPGMLAIRADGSSVRPGHGYELWMVDREDVVPDLADPCTLGGLLALVREAWGDPAVSVGRPRARGKWICSRALAVERVLDDMSQVYRPPDLNAPDLPGYWAAATEAEALVCALEAAP